MYYARDGVCSPMGYRDLVLSLPPSNNPIWEIERRLSASSQFDAASFKLSALPENGK